MSARQLDVGDLINRQRFSARQWRILMLCFLIVLCDGFDTAAIGYIAPAVIRDWGVARTQLGPVMSAALWGLAAARCWRAAGRPHRPQARAAGRGAAVRRDERRDLRRRRSGRAGLAAFRHRPGPGRGDGQRGDADVRVFSGAAAGLHRQRDVLRLSAGRGLWRVAGVVAGAACRLAQRAVAGRHRAAAAAAADVAVAA
ncbi:4-hydroxybenzoate transporter PcaK [Chromobacterium violaceum]|uniref:4-hydroxybenzoate transporter PcaK n=1 Tax=Chromobacterium violaceum TaxID=536 RepID=A0A447TIL3_CHRVL|nr:4-hydroxybenzoate transporter PcaK [Chromobacterium violaceum]